MEINNKIIRLPFWRTASYANYMRKIKGLTTPKRNKDENSSNNNIISINNNSKC